MKPLTKEWIEKAEGDFRTMEREARAKKYRNNDAICFHAQQCCEKYLKARLFEAGLEIKKIHDLSALLGQILPFEPGWNIFISDMAWLTQFGVTFRYPGESATKELSLIAINKCRKFRNAVRLKFGLIQD